eukprot:163266-Prymnesium_polylepis.1
MLARLRLPLAAAAAGASRLALCNDSKGLGDMMRTVMPIAGAEGGGRQGLSIKDIQSGAGADAYPG